MRRRRAVVVAVGSGGDIAPLSAAAGRLSTRGLQTTLIAPLRHAAFAPPGVDFRPAGADDVFESVFGAPAVWAARHGLAESWRHCGAAALTTLEQIRQGWSPDDTVLVTSSFAVGALLLAQGVNPRGPCAPVAPLAPAFVGTCLERGWRVI